MDEQTPLLKNKQQDPCCSSTTDNRQPPATCCSMKMNSGPAGKPACCSAKKKTKPCNGLPPVNDEDYCFLAEQKWEYKGIALACAILLASKTIALIWLHDIRIHHYLSWKPFCCSYIGCHEEHHQNRKHINAPGALLYWITNAVHRNLVLAIRSMVLFNRV